MSNDWMLNVLADLKAFSRVNGLPRLAERLDDTLVVAVDEIRHTASEQPVEVVSAMRDGYANGVRNG